MYPKNTRELYDALVRKPDLYSVPVLADDLLIWKLYKDAYIQASCDSSGVSIDIISDSVFLGSLIHWHSDEDDMLNELYTLGKKGNILVIKKSLFATEIFYMGSPERYSLLDKREWYLGKKKWDGGRLIYLEQK